MRFFADGPNLPDQLLNARDEGQVIFFCGAGVSRARAGLPDFVALAERVVQSLGTVSASPGRRLLEATQKQGRIDGVGSLTSADRIFGLLEREFRIRDVRAAVAQALKPTEPVDLTAHKILLDLARGPDGHVRLVTTNFDLLFERCEPGLVCSAPPGLPDPRHDRMFKGVVHLHGHVTHGYDGAHNDEFVLSSADFGRAYLAEGWATGFIRTLMQQYQLVFVGYTADDPPVQYLLEALNAASYEHRGLYAFQEGADEEADALWRHKGVTAIPYSSGNNHKALWQTLEAWAGRARDPNGWREEVLTRALDGPRTFSPVERGQVRHIVSTASGMRQFAERRPPAEWLCVLDSWVRFSNPSRAREDEESYDPFDAYSLDEDPAPLTPKPDNPYARRDRPPSVWDCFECTRLDRASIDDRHLADLRGPTAQAVPRLPERLAILGHWIAKSASQPAAIWWAAGQAGLHSDVQSAIRSEFERQPPSITCQRAWNYLFRAWASHPVDDDYGQFAIEAEIKRMGWSREKVRACAQIDAPRLVARRPLLSAHPPEGDVEFQINQVLSAEVEFPAKHIQFEVPDEFLPLYVAELRRGLDVAVELEREIYGYDGLSLPPIEPDENSSEDNRTFGVARPFFVFARALERLLAANPQAWLCEVRSWTDSGNVFGRLRVWAAGRKHGLSPGEAARVLLSLDDSVFWGSAGQRDLLLGLARRWTSFPPTLRRRLERRLLRGPPRWSEGESKAKHRERRAYEILTRLSWLHAEGGSFAFDLASEIQRLKKISPDWRESVAKEAATSPGGVGGFVTTDLSTLGLESESPAHLLKRAKELSGHEWGTLRESRPLAGMAATRPAKVLRALVMAAKAEDYAKWAWETFLYSEGRQADRRRMMAQIARRLAHVPTDALAVLAYPISDWLLRVAERIQEDAPLEFGELWSRLVEGLRDHPESTRLALLRNQGIDWAGHSLNSPVGKLAQVLMKDKVAASMERGFASAWLARVDQLLSLPGDAHRDAIVIFSRQIMWIFHRDQEWAENNLLSILSGEEKEDVRAFWAGFFWAADMPNQRLFVRLKAAFLNLVKRPQSTNADDLAAYLLAGWGTLPEAEHARLITDDEMREALIDGDDTFRSRVLWQLKTWAAQADDHGWKTKSIEFLGRVWPRQRSVRSSAMSERLVELALESEGSFAQTVAAILPFIDPLTPNSFALYRAKEDSEAIQSQPGALLALLYAVLGDRAENWPTHADQLVTKLAQLPDLAGDERLLDLRVRLAAR